MRIELDSGWLIREWREGDLASLVRYANNRNVWINLRDRFPHPYPEADGRDWIARCLESGPLTHFAIATTDVAIGGIGLTLQDNVYRRSAELGYWLGEPFWGRGIMTLAAHAIVEWAFPELDVRRIYSSVFPWNPAPSRALEKAGFSFEGRRKGAVLKDGQITDELLYGLVR